MKILGLACLVLLTALSTFGQDSRVEVIFRFTEVPDSFLRIRTGFQFPNTYASVERGKVYSYPYTRTLGHPMADTINLISTEKEWMGIVLQYPTQERGHFAKIYLDIPKFSKGRTVLPLQLLSKNDSCTHFTPTSQFTWKSAIQPCHCRPPRQTESVEGEGLQRASARWGSRHPVVSPSDTLRFTLNGNLMDDGSCDARLFFELFKYCPDSLLPVLVFPGFTPYLCGIGFQSFDSASVALPSMYDQQHLFGEGPVTVDPGAYVLRFVELGERKGFVYSDTVRFNTYLKIDKSFYNKLDSIQLTFQTVDGFGLRVTRCGPNTTYGIEWEHYNEFTREWETIGGVLPATPCPAIYPSRSDEARQLSLTVSIPHRHYDVPSFGKFRLRTVVYENQFKLKRLDCGAKAVYSDEFFIGL